MSSTRTIGLVPIPPAEAHNFSNIPPIASLAATALPAELYPTPSAEQIFQQESFSSMGKSRKIAILVLIVGCNFVQVPTFSTHSTP